MENVFILNTKCLIRFTYFENAFYNQSFFDYLSVLELKKQLEINRIPKELIIIKENNNYYELLSGLRIDEKNLIIKTNELKQLLKQMNYNIEGEDLIDYCFHLFTELELEKIEEYLLQFYEMALHDRLQLSYDEDEIDYEQKSEKLLLAFQNKKGLQNRQ